MPFIEKHIGKVLVMGLYFDTYEGTVICVVACVEFEATETA